MSGCSVQSETNAFGPTQQIFLFHVVYVVFCSCSGLVHILWRIHRSAHGGHSSYARKGKNKLCTQHHTGDMKCKTKKESYGIHNPAFQFT